MGVEELAVGPGRDDGFSPRVVYGFAEMVGVVSFVGNHGFRPEAIHQPMAARDVVALAWPEQQPHRVAGRVGGRVNLGAQAAA